MPSTKYIYWGDKALKTIGRAKRDGTEQNAEWLKAIGGEPGSVVTDSTYVYWRNVSTGFIGRAKLDGTGLNTEWLKAEKGVGVGLAITSTFIYWPTEAQHIGRAKIDGTEPKPEWLATTTGAFGLCVDETYIYWINNVEGGKIGRATLAGAEVKPELYKEVGGGQSIAVDNTYLYWVGENTHKIRRAVKVGGGPIEGLAEVTTTKGIAVDETYIYWATGPNIGRVKLNGTEKNEAWVEAPSASQGVWAGETPEVIPEPQPEPAPVPEPEPAPEPEGEAQAEAPAPLGELLLDAEEAPGISQSLGPYYLGGFRDHPDFLPVGLATIGAINLRLKMIEGKGVYRVRLLWHRKRELTAPYIEEELLLAEEAALLDQQFTVRAPWLTIELERCQLVQTAKFRAILAPVGSVGPQSRLGAPVLLSAPALEVPKEGTLQRTMARTAPGPASLVVAGGGEGATRTLQLESLTQTGAWTRYALFALPNLATPLSVPLTLPATPLRATLTNPTVAAITVDLLIGAS